MTFKQKNNHDSFTQHYMQHLDGTYDCVDRIVVNAYFILGQTGGGFRTWWRRLMGSDEHLDNTHLMRLAGRFARRVRAAGQCGRCPPDEVPSAFAATLASFLDRTPSTRAPRASHFPATVLHLQTAHHAHRSAYHLRGTVPQPVPVYSRWTLMADCRPLVPRHRLAGLPLHAVTPSLRPCRTGPRPTRPPAG